MRELLGLGGYTRQPEGYMSWQHIVFVMSLMAIMVALAVILGNHYKNKSYEQKNKVLMWAAIILDSCEIFRIIISCKKSRNS